MTLAPPPDAGPPIRALERGALLAALLLAACAGDRVATDRVATGRLNVYLITLDTTRADHLGCYGHDGIETPSIDRLAAEGTLYESAFTAVPITLPSHTAMLTGTYPAYHGVRENGGFYVPEELETLAEILAGEGYESAAFVGAFPLDSQTGLDQGFDLYDDNYPSRLDRHPRLRRFFDERPAAEVARAALAWIDARASRRPFFLWTHFFDPHQPMTPPSPYRERYAHAPYDGEIASVDEAVGQILRRLEARGRLERTLVILTADHGEGLGDHGEMTHALLLYSSTIRVPLIVRDPRDAGGVRVSAPVTTVDIFSTVLERLGVAVPAANQGVPLPRSDAAADAEREIYTETLFGRLIYGWSPMARLTAGDAVYLRGPSQRLHDRAADPDELADLAADRPAEAEDLARRLRSRRTRLAEGGHGFSRARASAETLARLAALGYLGSGLSGGGELSDEIDPARADPLAMMEVFNLHNEGQGLGDAGRHELAIPVLERARALDPGNPAVLMALAHSQLRIGEPELGRETLARLLEVSPEDLRTHLLLASYHHERGELEEAAALTERAVELDPGDLATRLMLAHLLEDTGRADDAEAAYRAILEREDDHVPALNGLATLRYRRGDAEGAVELLDAALERQPFYAPACLNLGVIEHDRGNHERSLRLARRALQLRPGYPQASELERRCLAALGGNPP